jgi:hypothetical protein
LRLAIAVLALAGCVAGKDSEVQRATEGPTAALPSA